MLALFAALVGTARAQCCGDCDGSGQVAINELVAGVNNLLQGCPTAVATPTAPHTATPTITVQAAPTATATPTATPRPTSAEMAFFIDDWRFEYTIISNFIEYYRFRSVTSHAVTGAPIVLGSNITQGTALIIARTIDLNDALALRLGDYAVLDKNLLRCLFHFFRITDTDLLTGSTIITTVTASNDCGNVVGNQFGYGMNGFRLDEGFGAAGAQPTERDSPEIESLRRIGKAMSQSLPR